MSTTVTLEPIWGPSIELTKTDDGGFEAVFGVDGLNPLRGTTAEERSAGIQSLNPPTVSVRSRRVAAEAHRELINVSARAVSTACTKTTGETGGPGKLLMLQVRVVVLVRRALRELGEDI